MSSSRVVGGLIATVSAWRLFLRRSKVSSVTSFTEYFLKIVHADLNGLYSRLEAEVAGWILTMIQPDRDTMGALEEKSALVTGASRSIGRGIAEAFGHEGAAVAVNYHSNEEGAKETVETIENEGGTAIPVQADVSNEDEARQLVKAVDEEFDRIDILVNNAGVLEPSTLDEMDVETWDQTISVDLRGTFLVTRFTIEGMLDQGSGRIINIASQLGIKGASELTHYSAAKGGVISFTRALAREVAPDVQVNAIAPGPIETDMLGDTTEEWRENKEAEVPLGRIGAVDEVVPTAVLLAGDGGDYYTGQTLSPDGGDAMH
ncbi:3-oxoacyl-ACP reductase family protein [Natrialba asiatica]|uniref:Short-chain family oxidoreductase n=1 Tax=Natrialba asiatica (strain ATCC 700177 / DSM 12278 / JCM 9576 / FERM P-10747 / NBRC 102637 / 172P1) TaxID=29540 RepID=M0B896_NATA1|nr:3-oxoacyl-ACP reductase family protein [Natrialba asiatica]ELZ05879.1 short-chain family oxidoreductase [Natrialba asiatica DSM 12278]